MKKSYCAVYEPRTKSITMYHVEPTLEWLQTTVEGYVEEHRPVSGVELYCDEDGQMKQLPLGVVVNWKGPAVGMEPTTVTFRGTVVFVFRRARNQAEALSKLATVLVGVVADQGPAWTKDAEPPTIH